MFESRKKNTELKAEKLDLLLNLRHDLIYLEKDYRNTHLEPEHYVLSIHTFHALDSSISSGKYLLLERSLQRKLDNLVIRLRIIEKLADYVVISRSNEKDVIRERMRKNMNDRHLEVKRMLPEVIRDVEEQIVRLAGKKIDAPIKNPE